MVLAITLEHMVEELRKEVDIKKRKAINALVSYGGNLDHMCGSREITRRERTVCGVKALLIKSKKGRFLPTADYIDYPYTEHREVYVRGIAREADMNMDKADEVLHGIERITNRILGVLKSEKIIVMGSGGAYLYRSGREYFIPTYWNRIP